MCLTLLFNKVDCIVPRHDTLTIPFYCLTINHRNGADLLILHIKHFAFPHKVYFTKANYITVTVYKKNDHTGLLLKQVVRENTGAMANGQRAQ